MTIECSNLTYKKLQSVRIQERTRQVKEDLSQIFLHKVIWNGKANQILEDARSSEVLSEEQQDVLSLEAELESQIHILQMDPSVIEHPFLVAQVVFGKDLDNFSQYGFSSKRDLAIAVNAYCIGEKKVIEEDRRSYIWRQGDYKNIVSLEDHGDMQVSQIDVSGTELVLMDPPRLGYGLQQDWSPFLISILKYAQAIGKKDIPEIRNWQELIRELRRSNPWGTEYSDDFTEKELNLTILFDRDLLGATDENLKLQINDTVIPYFNDGNLDILRESKNGDIEVRVYRELERFKRIVVYTPNDIPHLIKANYQLYARSVNDMAKVMYWFNNVV